MMTAEQIMRVFDETAYIHTGGTEEELRCAKYLVDCCRELGLEAKLESYPVEMSDMQEQVLLCDGERIPCRGWFCCGSAEVEAPFYYLRNTDPWSWSQCKGKIVLVDGRVDRWVYRDLVEHGAVGFIDYEGNLFFEDEDINQRWLQPDIRQASGTIPGVSINAKRAVEIIRKGVKTAKIILKQQQYEGTSNNVVLELPGEREEHIVLSAHYDSTALSQGAYDNMTGSVGLLALAEHFAKRPHRYGLRFVWCGCEERGFLGSKAYCEAHGKEQAVLNINLDMIGSHMGKFLCYCTAEERVLHYLGYMAAEIGIDISCLQDVYPSDSTIFADCGVPALTFARIAPPGTASIHTRYDTKDLVSAEQLQADIRFLTAFTERMANAARCPISGEIPDNMKEKLDVFSGRKRGKK